MKDDSKRDPNDVQGEVERKLEQDLEPSTGADPAAGHTPGLEGLGQRLKKLEAMEQDLEKDAELLEGVEGEPTVDHPHLKLQGGSEAEAATDKSAPSVRSSGSTRAPKVSDPPAEFPKKVAIIGSAQGWEAAPYDDPSWSIWGLSRMYHSLPRWDVWFEIHPWDRLCERRDGQTPQVEQMRLRAEYQQWLQQDHGRPIFMKQHYPQVPNCVVYPLEQILEVFPGDPYFTNSVSYMIALALFQGVEQLAIYGVDMATKEEYTDQRSGVEYWVGLARGAGVDVLIPSISDLCKARVLYGMYDDPEHDKLTLKLDTAMRQLAEAEKMGRQAELAMANAKGAKQILEWMLRNY